MSKLTKAEVTKEAKKVQAVLGKDWAISLDEDVVLGWHWTLTKGVMQLVVNGQSDSDGNDVVMYTAFFNTYPQVVCDDKNPVRAVHKAFAQARVIIEKIQLDIHEVESEMESDLVLG